MGSHIWLLGAKSPAIDAIEALLIECKEDVVHAVDKDGNRISRHDQNAVATIPPLSERLKSAYYVGCAVVVVWSDELNREDCPGCYINTDFDAVNDAKFLSASMVGQVISLLAKTSYPEGEYGKELGRHWQLGNCGDIARQPGEFRLQHRMSESHVDFWTVRLAQDWTDTTNSRVATVPNDIVFAAATESCTDAALRGELPGVNPKQFRVWLESK